MKVEKFDGNMYSLAQNSSQESRNEKGYIEKASLSPENLLLTGTQLKNTKTVFGVCVYTGRDTKINLNSKIAYNKFSSIEYSLNKFLLAYICLMFIGKSNALIQNYTTRWR